MHNLMHRTGRIFSVLSSTELKAPVVTGIVRVIKLFEFRAICSWGLWYGSHRTSEAHCKISMRRGRLQSPGWEHFTVDQRCWGY